MERAEKMKGKEATTYIDKDIATKTVKDTFSQNAE